MVGVPGRSKGCNTCRKRKIRCSQQRPECSQCLKSGRKCLGYERERTFIAFAGPGPTSHGSSGSEQDSHEDESLTLSSEGSIPSVESQAVLTQSVLLPKYSNFSFLSGPSDSNSAHGLYNLSMRQGLMGQFYSAFQKEILGGHPNWMCRVPGFTFGIKVVETASMAYCLSGIGRQKQSESMRRESLGLYTRALKELQQALWDQDAMYEDETLAACMLLAMYEVTECPDKGRGAFISHYNGLSRLIELRGPEAHIKGLAHSVFIHFRSFAAIQALETKSTFLVSDSWKTIPFASGFKTRYDGLIDLLLFAPSILQRSERMDLLPPEEKLREGISVFQGCFELDQKLCEFSDDMENDNHFSPTFWVKKSSQEIHIVNPCERMTEQYDFADVMTAVTRILLWAMQSVLWSGMTHLQIMIGGLQTHFGLERSLPGWNMRFMRFDVPARNVLQSATYFLMHEPSSRIAVAPLAMVVDTLVQWPGFEPELKFARAMLKEIENRGMKIVKYIGAYENAKGSTKLFEE